MSKKRQDNQLSNLILTTFAIVIVLLTLSVVLISINLTKSQTKFDSANDKNITLQNKMNSLAPNQISLPAGQFPLEANEKLLTSAYLRLMTFVYKESNSDTNFIKNKATLIQYFGKDGYKQLRNESLYSASGKMKSLSKNLIDCKIMFSNFSLKTKTIEVTIYSEYQLANPTENGNKGISVITLNYNFDNLTANDFNIRSANINNKDLL